MPASVSSATTKSSVPAASSSAVVFVLEVTRGPRAAAAIEAGIGASSSTFSSLRWVASSSAAASARFLPTAGCARCECTTRLWAAPSSPVMSSAIATASTFPSVSDFALTVAVEEDTASFVLAAVVGVVELGMGVSLIWEATSPFSFSLAASASASSAFVGSSTSALVDTFVCPLIIRLVSSVRTDSSSAAAAAEVATFAPPSPSSTGMALVRFTRVVVAVSTGAPTVLAATVDSALTTAPISSVSAPGFVLGFIASSSSYSTPDSSA
mmetsp:Transcript_24833/g.61902  ORF Transcript_24833/g.61902 Transcript_24833/m.61902 type:complete len:268 (+) Transcript_24833:152-955(+)